MAERWAVLGDGLSAVAFLRSLRTELAESNSYLGTPGITIVTHGEKTLSKGTEAAPATGKLVPDGTFTVPDQGKTSSYLIGNLSGTKLKGGWSEVWGATFALPDETWLQTLDPEIRDEFEIAQSALPSLFPLLLTNTSASPSKESDLRNLPPIALRSSAQTGQAMSAGSASVFFQPSQLFIRPLNRDQTIGCNQCGECLTGCPGGHILNASREIDRELEKPNTSVEGEFTVERVGRAQDGSISIFGSKSGLSKTLHGFDKVIFALGPLQTPAVLLRSAIAVSPLTVKESFMAIVPFIDPRTRLKEVPLKRIALADVFLRSGSGRYFSEQKQKSAFCQIYAYSDSLDEQICRRLPPLTLLPKRLRQAFLSKFGFAMCFMPDSFGPGISLSLEPETVRIDTAHAAKRIRGTLAILRTLILGGLLPVFPMIIWPPPGHSYHLGGSLPMKAKNQLRKSSNWSNGLGEPNGYASIHIVDSSSLPAVPASPITCLAMSNAVRIGRALGKQYTGKTHDLGDP